MVKNTRLSASYQLIRCLFIYRYLYEYYLLYQQALLSQEQANNDLAADNQESELEDQPIEIQEGTKASANFEPKLQKACHDYLHARYYSSNMSRFLEIDPLTMKGDSVARPQGWNLFSYCTNNPIYYFDPDGRNGTCYGTSRLYSTGNNAQIAGDALRSIGITGLLDAVGTVPVVGEGADGINAIIHLFKGDFKGAFLCAVSMVPVVGDALGKGGKVLKYANETAEVGIEITKKANSLGKTKKALSMNEALDETSKFLDLGSDITSINGKTGVQFIQSSVDASGKKIVKRAGFDINPNSPHVKKLGPHLNLQKQVDGKVMKGDPHLPIDSKTVKNGDY